MAERGRRVPLRWPRPRGVRNRAALAAALTAAVAFGAGGLAIRQLVFQDRLDQVRESTDRLAQSVVQQMLGSRVPETSALIDQTYEVVLDDGHLLEASPDLAPYEVAGAVLPPLPGSPDGALRSRTVRLGPLPRSPIALSAGLRGQSEALADRTWAVRSATVHGMAPQAAAAYLGPGAGGGHSFTVHILVPRWEAERVRASLDRLLLTGVFAATGFVVVVARAVTGRALRPVERIREGMAEVSASELHRRVPVPPDGDEITRLALTTNQTLDRLEEAVARQQRFVADASHELRSPVANLRTGLEVALAHPSRTHWPEVARDALANTERLHRLIDDLLVLARLDATAPAPDAADVKLTAVDLAAVDLAAVVRAECAGRGGPGARLRLSGGEPVPVAGDRGQLRRLVRNLLDNAERHARSEIRVAVSADGAGRARLVVADDGPGIPAAERQRVFERFTRLDDARARDDGGSGLGLAIVREIAVRHGGTVEADAAEGGGARLTVLLPGWPGRPGPVTPG
ncbi:sensor histidine kinase [Streptomyces sp. NPDC092296]|uniref:sensor histidine kinase n=1 Tax=Streptomyces sp. NPDC092296 TaxID=3366012 RepID=UPI003802E955